MITVIQDKRRSLNEVLQQTYCHKGLVLLTIQEVFGRRPSLVLTETPSDSDLKFQGSVDKSHITNSVKLNYTNNFIPP